MDTNFKTKKIKHCPFLSKCGLICPFMIEKLLILFNIYLIPRTGSSTKSEPL